MSQDKTEKMLIQYQLQEHQPQFSVKLNLYPIEPDGLPQYQEFEIMSEGEEIMQSPAKVAYKTYIKVEYADKENRFIGYYPLRYYFGAGYDYKNLTGPIFESILSQQILNFKLFMDLRNQALPDSLSGHFDLSLIHHFTIEYKDIYGETRLVYFENSNRTSQDNIDFVQTQSEKYGDDCKSIQDVALSDLLSLISHD